MGLRRERGSVKLLFLVLGGASGTLARFAVSVSLTPRLLALQPGGPWALLGATLLVNLGGALLLGYLSAQSHTWPTPNWRIGLAAGFCGAFTTFSTFSLELVTLWNTGHQAAAVLYWLGSSAGGIGAILLGQQLARSV